MKTQKQIISDLNNLVGNRFNENTLNEKLSKIFNEQIKVEDVSRNDDELTDYNFLFVSEKEETHGYFDIYFLKMRKKGFDDSNIYISEIGYEFD
jgi:hypothetical protein